MSFNLLKEEDFNEEDFKCFSFQGPEYSDENVLKFLGNKIYKEFDLRYFYETEEAFDLIDYFKNEMIEIILNDCSQNIPNCRFKLLELTRFYYNNPHKLYDTIANNQIFRNAYLGNVVTVMRQNKGGLQYGALHDEARMKYINYEFMKMFTTADLWNKKNKLYYLNYLKDNLPYKSICRIINNSLIYPDCICFPQAIFYYFYSYLIIKEFKSSQQQEYTYEQYKNNIRETIFNHNPTARELFQGGLLTKYIVELIGYSTRKRNYDSLAMTRIDEPVTKIPKIIKQKFVVQQGTFEIVRKSEEDFDKEPPMGSLNFAFRLPEKISTLVLATLSITPDKAEPDHDMYRVLKALSDKSNQFYHTIEAATAKIVYMGPTVYQKNIFLEEDLDDITGKQKLVQDQSDKSALFFFDYEDSPEKGETQTNLHVHKMNELSKENWRVLVKRYIVEHNTKGNLGKNEIKQYDKNLYEDKWRLKARRGHYRFCYGFDIFKKYCNSNRSIIEKSDILNAQNDFIGTDFCGLITLLPVLDYNKIQDLDHLLCEASKYLKDNPTTLKIPWVQQILAGEYKPPFLADIIELMRAVDLNAHIVLVGKDPIVYYNRLNKNDYALMIYDGHVEMYTGRVYQDSKLPETQLQILKDQMERNPDFMQMVVLRNYPSSH